MINIKTYSKSKNSGGGDNNNSSSSSSSSNNVSTQLNDWFYFDAENQAVVCRYNFIANGDISAYKQQQEEE